MELHPDGLTCIKTYSNSFQAQLMCSKLQSEGIEAYVFDENINSVQPLYNQVVGGTKIMVRNEDKVMALEICSDDQLLPITNEEGVIVRCTKCNSQNIESGTSGIKSPKSLLGFILGFVTFSWPLFLDSIYYCKDCGHVFKKDK